MLDSKAMQGEDLPRLLEWINQLVPSDQTVFLVGGAVRDILLNRPVHDVDFVLPGEVRKIARKVANAIGGAFFMLDDERNTARVIQTREEGSRLVIDFATLRAADLEGDLRARDFTINAIAMEASAPHRMIDLLGGAADLRQKRLRACSESAFQADPVRVLRGVRLAVELKFSFEPQTLQDMRQAVPLLARTSPERQRDECCRMLDGRGVASALRMLDQLGALAIFLPELGALKAVRPSPPHLLDGWEHTLATAQALERLLGVLMGEYQPDSADNLILGMATMRLGRFRQPLAQHFEQPLNVNRTLRSLLFMAALYHDVGKAKTRQEDSGGAVHFFGHEDVSANAIATRARHLAFSQVEIQRLDTIVRHHMRIHHLANTEEPQPTRRAIYRFFRDTGAAGVEICLLSLADLWATYGVTLPPEFWAKELEICRGLLESWWERPQETVNPPVLLTGDDLMRQFALTPGPLIGELLQRVREAQACGEVATPDEALRLVEAALNESGSQSAER